MGIVLMLSIYIIIFVLIPLIIVFSIKTTKKRNRENFKQRYGYTPEAYEQIKKQKELLDLGILTQEEFEEKKKQLLNI
ncbi:MAG: SHOCT domain-containing protein [Acutalibacteraceae bacterium]|nr:SHOCT domain-containing protein [Acutalibacteraceae bacterium]